MINEKDVENYYRNYLLKNLTDSSISSPFKTDGILERDTLKMLLEFKYDLDMNIKDNKVICLIQAICYLKQMELKGVKLPQIIFVGDKNEAFILHTNDVIKYLSWEVDWKIAPSNAYKSESFKDMRLDLNNNDDINPFVFKHDDKAIFSKIEELATNTNRKIRLTIQNIENAYKYFTEKTIIKDKLATNELANLFIQIIVNPNENYKHPKKKGVLVTKAKGDLKINPSEFDSYFKHFEGDVYSNKEKKELINQVDRLVEDSTRRMKGEFYTPTIWVNKAHEYIESVFGDDWKEKYVIWDNSCGTGALTKDYKFDTLIQTTIEQSDIETIEQAGINKGSTKKQLDFLNDDIPKEIVDIIKDKEIIVFMNPPYATAGNNKRDDESKEGVAESKARDEMIKDKWSGYGQLYAQFIYRSLMLKKYGCKVNLAFFSKCAYLSSSTFKELRKKMSEDVEYEKGFMFNASEFSGTSNKWTVAFSLFKNKN